MPERGEAPSVLRRLRQTDPRQIHLQRAGQGVALVVRPVRRLRRRPHRQVFQQKRPAVLSRRFLSVSSTTVNPYMTTDYGHKYKKILKNYYEDSYFLRMDRTWLHLSQNPDILPLKSSLNQEICLKIPLENMWQFQTPMLTGIKIVPCEYFTNQRLMKV